MSEDGEPRGWVEPAGGMRSRERCGRSSLKWCGVPKSMSTLPEWGALQAKPNFGAHGFVEPRLGTDPGRWRRWLADDFRRWDRVSGEDGRIFNEEAEHQPIGPRGAGRKKSMPALVPERFAHVLIGRPSLPAWSRQRQADALESTRIAEIGHVEGLHSMAPDVAGELVHRW
jgi:hypothetical protein